VRSILQAMHVLNYAGNKCEKRSCMQMTRNLHYQLGFHTETKQISLCFESGSSKAASKLSLYSQMRTLISQETRLR
jgi:hypothetical protein